MKSEADNNPGASDPEITLVVQTINGEYKASFPKVAKIADVIAAAVKHFGFGGNDAFELVREDNRSEVLQPQRTLVSYHLTDGTRLMLTATVKGV